ncbi:kinase-like protein [Ceratobasidium sp. AG-I]|nr:kinase-like protein [Ceratobasidium sp. AG-I]
MDAGFLQEDILLEESSDMGASTRVEVNSSDQQTEISNDLANSHPILHRASSVNQGGPSYAPPLSEFEITSETPLDAVINYFRHESILQDYTAELEHAVCSRYPVATGGLADIYNATLSSGAIVAIKRMRSGFIGEGKATKRTARELHTWSRLRHNNILEILGLAVFGGKLAMISPWMSKGNVMHYIENHPYLDKYSLVVEAVVYLHQMDVVHGDLKGDNVLVSDDGTLKLTDFGLTIMHELHVRFSTTEPGGGTYRWMAPELGQDESSRSKEADIYALGMTMLQLFTGQIPFPEIRSDMVIINEVMMGGRKPECPLDLIQTPRDQLLWNVFASCWVREPAHRATAEVHDARVAGRATVPNQPLVISGGTPGAIHRNARDVANAGAPIQGTIFITAQSIASCLPAQCQPGAFRTDEDIRAASGFGAGPSPCQPERKRGGPHVWGELGDLAVVGLVPGEQGYVWRRHQL